MRDQGGAVRAGPDSIEQLRARHAWTSVQTVKRQPAERREKYAQHARKMPARVLTSGLGQALAFLATRKEADALLQDLSAWVAQRWPPSPTEDRDLLQRIIHGNSLFLRRATDEVLAYLQWLNRFADAEGLGPDALEE